MVSRNKGLSRRPVVRFILLIDEPASAPRRPLMTKIASVETYMISVLRPQPVRTAHEEIKAWNVILTEVRTDDGLVGYGEIHGAPMPRICQWVARFGEIIRGMDALAHVAGWEKLVALTSPRPGGVEGRESLPPPGPRGGGAQVMAVTAGR